MNNVFNAPQESTQINMAFVYGGIALLVVVLIALGTHVTWHVWSGSPWYYDQAYAVKNMWNWWNPPHHNITPSGALQEVTESVVQPAAPVTQSTSERNPAGPPESWCFIGEDLTGRYCLKVPSDTSCDTERLFRSRRDCELIPANHMTAGIVTKGGVDIRPLSSVMIV